MPTWVAPIFSGRPRKHPPPEDAHPHPPLLIQGPNGGSSSHLRAVPPQTGPVGRKGGVSARGPQPPGGQSVQGGVRPAAGEGDGQAGQRPRLWVRSPAVFLGSGGRCPSGAGGETASGNPAAGRPRGPRPRAARGGPDARPHPRACARRGRRTGRAASSCPACEAERREAQLQLCPEASPGWICWAFGFHRSPLRPVPSSLPDRPPPGEVGRGRGSPLEPRPPLSPPHLLALHPLLSLHLPLPCPQKLWALGLSRPCLSNPGLTQMTVLGSLAQPDTQI